MSAHTPGPWSVSRCCCGHPSCRDFWISSGKFCQGSGFGESDARLVAAAPDLLAALVLMVQTVDGYEGPHMDAARTAIAKATQP